MDCPEFVRSQGLRQRTHWEWDGEVDTFVLAWDRYTAGLDAAGRDYGYSRLLRSSDHDRAAQALRINADQLPKGLDQQGFIAFLDSLSGTYQRQTDAARALICSLTEDGSFELHAA
ncbi:hypothetical protein AHiyo8_01640 [Arthrobacter sp. Hiyo8]|uniref:hypothetical protein n=1 Tax=Arthrobacter sp. Hiyo1 TaxID=1588020 RepID=UPI0006839383|nr:hypothetical protein [Arthrobacter sp. Hiyo1]BAS11861.1 hypothetical protein AHiyo8_01640 [Arthrobacter sp. Hiyo8]GAP61341.1 hypothetical protein AHiyo1_50340 [Arthrobacter sp. Hiyo1]